jgi:hypothetical protein
LRKLSVYAGNVSGFAGRRGLCLDVRPVLSARPLVIRFLFFGLLALPFGERILLLGQ